MTTNFHTAKKGDRVWSLSMGWGTIDSVCNNRLHPIHVEFDYGRFNSYTLDGRITKACDRDLFWGEVGFKIPTKPLKKRRKVREDFNRDLEYYVDVSGRSEDVKREVQKAFFDVGFRWRHLDMAYHNLDALFYGNSIRDGITYLESWNKPSSAYSLTPKEFLDLVYEPMMQSAEDAALGYLQPTSEVAKLVEALESILEMQECNYGDAVSTHIDLIHLAAMGREALSSYRAQVTRD